MEPSGTAERLRKVRIGVNPARVARGLDKVPSLGLSDRGEGGG